MTTPSTEPTTTQPAMTRRTFLRRPRLGFRARVLGAFVALVAAAIIIGLFVQRALLFRSLDSEIEDGLQQERAELETLAAGRNPETGQPFGRDAQAILDTFLRRNLPEEGEVYVTFINGAPYRTTPAPVRLDTMPDLAARWASLTAGERGELSTHEGDVEYLAVPLTSEGTTRGVFVVANFTRGEREEIESALRIEAAVSAVVLLGATAMAWFVAGRLLRPVRNLTTTAERISDSELTARIPVQGEDEIARLGRTFNEMLDRLEAAFTAQRSFVADAGHELRTPITIVRGHLEVMGDEPDERRRTVELVSDELDRMARIVDDLLLLAQAEQPDFVQPEPIELTDFTTELLAKGRTLDDRAWRLDACAEGTVRVDPQRLTQAMLNLARNAVEHTVRGDEIGIGSAWSHDGFRLWVRDTGAGIDHAEQERIFERFARGAGGRQSDGAGLGLAIVRSVAAAHGGTVELDSAPGRGATFALVLPGTPPPPTVPPASSGSDDSTVELDVTQR
jgi:signal transduction histidine kinase